LTHISSALSGLTRHARDRVNYSVSKLLHRRVDVERFNTLLDDEARLRYAPAIKTLWRVVPGVMRRKIPRANVQQGYMLAAVEQLAGGLWDRQMLCVGGGYHFSIQGRRSSSCVQALRGWRCSCQ
jgi:hypothetical protein